ncbi:uncharacterized protein LOC101864250 [Aplysia californica]|uniref:Uncharacterized protein LOC101864250 n=1 Tax=Aplysia californica TaxID=6500 RepID=A0ABM1A7K4_APLCA|nr:uncharacterized protein LOC101864250 [Aplysia californica]
MTVVRMVVYSCKCLNVQVFGQEPQQRFDSDSLETCPLGAKGKVIELIDPGFNFTHKCLVHRERNDPWTVYICVPCHMRTHAVNVRANLLVINSEMEDGEEAVLAMRSRPEYSKVFKLVLANQDGKHREDGVVKPQSHETLQKQLGDLQAVVCSYLKAEEEVMERRIRKFEAEQRAQFDKLTDHVKSEKTKLVSVLFQNSERRDFSAMADKNPSKGHANLSHSKSAIEYNRTTPQNLNQSSRERNTRRMRDSSPDVFAMEELELEDHDGDDVGVPIRSENSRRSERSDYSASPEQYGRQRSTHVSVPEETINEMDDGTLMSTSVPISMPTGHFRNLKSHTFREDDLEEETAEFDDIPRHMQQLSESIQERDRYIFGDRPRQRVHTGDFTQVKWK